MLISVSVTRKITADYDCIFADNFDILPTDFYILIPAKKSEAFASAPYYHRHKTPIAGVYFYVADTAESATRLRAYDLLIPQVRNTAVHFITSVIYMAQTEMIMNQ